MRHALVNPDILSYFFKGEQNVVGHFRNYFKSYPRINISIITYYEILSGLEHLKAGRQISYFETFVNANNILHLSQRSVKISAMIYGELKREGIEIGNSDLLIAGLAVDSELVLVANNEKHFNQIPTL